MMLPPDCPQIYSNTKSEIREVEGTISAGFPNPRPSAKKDPLTLHYDPLIPHWQTLVLPHDHCKGCQEGEVGRTVGGQRGEGEVGGEDGGQVTPPSFPSPRQTIEGELRLRTLAHRSPVKNAPQKALTILTPNKQENIFFLSLYMTRTGEHQEQGQKLKQAGIQPVPEEA
eukprot:1146996-Pelagomonas_calceolata.AAC.3